MNDDIIQLSSKDVLINVLQVIKDFLRLFKATVQLKPKEMVKMRLLAIWIHQM